MKETNQKVYDDLEHVLQSVDFPLESQQTLWLSFISRCLAQIADDIHELCSDI